VVATSKAARKQQAKAARKAAKKIAKSPIRSVSIESLDAGKDHFLVTLERI